MFWGFRIEGSSVFEEFGSSLDGLLFIYLFGVFFILGIVFYLL